MSQSDRKNGSAKPVIGIVGGVGAGKSTVAAELVKLGCARIDADAIGHELLGDADVRGQIRRRWGEGAFDAEGHVRRDALGEIVFSDPAELRALNEILHPRIRRRIEREIDRARADPDAAAVVLDAAVLLEARWDDLCTHLVFVGAPNAERAQRVRRQRAWDAAAWSRREKMQISLDSKARRSDHRIDNSSNFSHLREQVRRLFRSLHTADRTQ